MKPCGQWTTQSINGQTTSNVSDDVGESILDVTESGIDADDVDDNVDDNVDDDADDDVAVDNVGDVSDDVVMVNVLVDVVDDVVPVVDSVSK